MRNKKAQLQIMENAFILLVLFIILVIAFIFAMGMMRKNQEKKLEEFRQLDMLKRSQVLSFLPELQCSDNNNLNSDCYDILKIDAFEAKLKTKEGMFFYKDILGNTKITINKYNPSPGVNKIYDPKVIYDNPLKDDKDYKEIEFPILLKDPTDDKSPYFGSVTLGVYG
jgi:hypothetical protein